MECQNKFVKNLENCQENVMSQYMTPVKSKH